jgi:hypothetical protein
VKGTLSLPPASKELDPSFGAGDNDREGDSPWRERVTVPLLKWTLAGCFFLIGAAAFGWGLSHLLRRGFIVGRGRHCLGTVVELRQKATDEGPDVLAPVVAFETERGEVRITGLYASICSYRIGQQVSVFFLPDKPEAAVLTTRAEIVKEAFLVAGGLVFALIGLVVLVVEIE